MRRRTRALVASMALVPAIAFTGCGAGGDLLEINASATPQFLAQSAERTAEIATGRIEVEITAEGGGLTATGSFDAPRQAAALQVTATGNGETLSSDVVLVDGEVYVRPGGFAGLLGDLAGTPWLKAGVDDLAGMLPGTIDAPTVDPGEITDRLRAEGIEVTEVGPEDVRGVATTHYRADVPADADRPEWPPAQVDVWIDATGLVRRVDVAAQGDTPITVRAELFDLGEPVDIAAPPADEVTDLGRLDDLLELLPR